MNTHAAPLLTALVSGLFAVGCASSTPGAQPDDMSAAQHRTEADAHEAEAKAHEAQYDPNQTALRRGATAPGIGRLAAASIDWRTYNPTLKHLSHAAEHKGHAEDHREAAAALEKDAGEACAAVPVPIRAACPLETQVTAVAPTNDGVRLTIAEGVQPAAILAHARCHATVGATLGREGMDGCPLYLKGLDITLSEDASALEIRSSDPATRKRIEGRARAMLQE